MNIPSKFDKLTLKKMRTQYTGAGIVDLMVGLFIGLLVMLTVMETVVFMQAMRRTGISSNATLNNLVTGIYGLTHDLQMAGLGLSAPSVGTCTRLNAFFGGTVLSDGGFIAPAQITSGGGDPDSLTIFYGNAITGAAPNRVLKSMASGTDTIPVNLSADIPVGSAVLLMEQDDSIPCTLMGVTAVIDTGVDLTLSHDSAGSAYNPANPASTYTNNVLYSSNAILTTIGTPSWSTWRVNAGNLEVVNQVSGAANVIATDIIYLRAQYGVSNGANNDLVDWVDATGEWAVLDRAHILRIRGIRVSLIARAPQREKPTVAGGACDATTVAPEPWPGDGAIDLSGDANWRCHRYRVVRTIVPIKNLVWSMV